MIGQRPGVRYVQCYRRAAEGDVMVDPLFPEGEFRFEDGRYVWHAKEKTMSQTTEKRVPYAYTGEECTDAMLCDVMADVSETGVTRCLAATVRELRNALWEIHMTTESESATRDPYGMLTRIHDDAARALR